MRILFCLGIAVLSNIALAQQNTAASPAAEKPAEATATTTTPSTTAPLADANKLTLLFSPYTYHTENKPTHRHVFLLGVEREHANAKLDGVVLFRNSFGQPSIYVYPWGGVYKSIFSLNNVNFKWTGGLIYGYTGEFKDEVAHWKGLAPVIIVGLAYEFKPGWSLQVNSLGKLAAQIQLNMPIGK